MGGASTAAAAAAGTPSTTDQAAPGHGTAIDSEEAHGRRWTRSWWAGVLAAVGYLALAVGMWWHVWTSSPRTTTVCGCGDSSFTLWFFEFAARALRTGSSPFATSLLWHPHGITVLDQASPLGLGLPTHRGGQLLRSVFHLPAELGNPDQGGGHAQAHHPHYREGMGDGPP